VRSEVGRREFPRTRTHRPRASATRASRIPAVGQEPRSLRSGCGNAIHRIADEPPSRPSCPAPLRLRPTGDEPGPTVGGWSDRARPTVTTLRGSAFSAVALLRGWRLLRNSTRYVAPAHCVPTSGAADSLALVAEGGRPTGSYGNSVSFVVIGSAPPSPTNAEPFRPWAVGRKGASLARAPRTRTPHETLRNFPPLAPCSSQSALVRSAARSFRSVSPILRTSHRLGRRVPRRLAARSAAREWEPAQDTPRIGDLRSRRCAPNSRDPARPPTHSLPAVSLRRGLTLDARPWARPRSSRSPVPTAVTGDRRHQPSARR